MTCCLLADQIIDDRFRVAQEATETARDFLSCSTLVLAGSYQFCLVRFYCKVLVQRITGINEQYVLALRDVGLSQLVVAGQDGARPAP